ncbi:MAG: hypothetical protein ACT4R6_11815 [Gemmatimonadaceae bacterium]
MPEGAVWDRRRSPQPSARDSRPPAGIAQSLGSFPQLTPEVPMVPLSSLWLPILLSAVFVFLASWVVHMLLGYHRSDFARLPQEDQVLDALRPFAIPPGSYHAPHAGGPADMKSPVFMEKLKRGPVLLMRVWPAGPFNMGKLLSQWFVYCLVVSLFAAYLASRTLTPNAEYLAVFRVAGTTAFVGYVLALWQDYIWYGRSTSSSLKATFDGLVYALLTGGTFGWLWPSAV